MHLTANLANQTKMLHQRNPNPTKLKTKFTLELIANYRTTKRKETHKFPNLRNFPLLEPDQNKSPHPTEPKTEIRKRITSRFQNFIFDSFLPPELSRQPNQTDGKRITKKKKKKKIQRECTCPVRPRVMVTWGFDISPQTQLDPGERERI